jgi:two-component system cell cycle sensor histidine kinase/response regulator CckA
VEAPKRETILLVDDEPSIRMIASEILLRQGYQVLVAASGQEALQICRDHPGTIQLLLTDLIMPGMSGLDLVTQAITVRPQMRVVYISESYLLKQAFAHEPDLAFIDKPFSAEDLIKKVAEVLGSIGTA